MHCRLSLQRLWPTPDRRGVSPVELLAGKLSAVHKLMTDMTIEFTNLKRSIIDTSIGPIGKLNTDVTTLKLYVTSVEESCTANDSKYTKLITDLTEKQSVLEQFLADLLLTVDKPMYETMSLTWTAKVDDALTNDRSNIRSKDFIGTRTTSSTLYLLGSFTSVKFSFYIYKDCDKSKNKNPTVIKELDITTSV